MMRDGRNPYGSRGGYVRDRRMYDYDDYDMRRERDYMPRDRRHSRGLNEEDLDYWTRDLLDEIEDKQHFRLDAISHKAEEMGIRFDKFTPQELYATVLMLYTDFCDVLGTGNLDLYVKLAKKWLCDKDASVKYGEKLAAYYENIVDGF